ncbi:hypothetical protein [Streptomyces sp. NPDC059753]|uniref:hypothetical protein n=2 Tax=Streptomyces TaxID=1883 RepID=UPI0036620743
MAGVEDRGALVHETSRMHREVMDGRVRLPKSGAVVAGERESLPRVVIDGAGRRIPSVNSYLLDRMLGDVSPLTCRSYGNDLLRWVRVLWAVDVLTSLAH